MNQQHPYQGLPSIEPMAKMQANGTQLGLQAGESNQGMMHASGFVQAEPQRTTELGRVCAIMSEILAMIHVQNNRRENLLGRLMGFQPQEPQGKEPQGADGPVIATLHRLCGLIGQELQRSGAQIERLETL